MNRRGDNFRLLTGEVARQSFMAWYLAEVPRAPRLVHVLPVKPRGQG